MTFKSILYRRIRPAIPAEQVEAPDFFHDLNIDQIVAGVTGKDEYNLKPFFIVNSPMSTRSPTGSKS